MKLLSALLAAGAVLLYLPTSKGQGALSRLSAVAERSPRVPRRRQRRVWGILGAVGAVAGAGTVGGIRAAVVVTATVLVTGTALLLIVWHRQLRAARLARASVAHAADLLASQLRVGRVPAEALLMTAADCPVMVEAAQVHRIGGDPTAVWLERAREPGHAGLRDLARAWRLSTRTGAPLAAALEKVSEGLTADIALRRLVAAELAAPRATGKIMAVLPACGLGIGYAIGGQPLTFLLSSQYGWVCLIGGVALAAGGVLWIEVLARRAVEE